MRGQTPELPVILWEFCDAEFETAVFEEASEQPDVHSSSVWRDSGVLFCFCVTSRRDEGEDIECFSVSLFERLHPPSFQHRFVWLPFSRTLVCKGGQQLFVLSCTREHEIRVFEPELRCCVTLA